MSARLNVDTVQTIEWESSRFSPEKGKGSAGTVDIRTQMGDDRWRFGGTNFVPGLGSQGGVYVNHWSPRVTFSGPLRKRRAWFHNAFESFYAADTVSQLPQGQNRSSSISGSNLSRLEVNIGDHQIFTASFLINLVDARRDGLSFLDPVETTVNRRQTLLLGTMKDQFTIGGGLLEVGFADTSAYLRAAPQGSRPYVITPYGAAGNFFRDESRRANRQEWLINEFVRPVHWHGSHQFEAGADVQRSDLDEIILRHEFSVVRVDNSVVRNVLFLGSPRQFRTNIEAYSYALDRWNPRPDLTIEAGFRTQWDEYTRGAPPAPRLAAAWSPRWSGGTKFSAGWGIFYDAVTLGDAGTEPGADKRQHVLRTLRARAGSAGSIRFILRPQDLRLPRFAIASFSAERRLPWNVYGRLNLIARQGSRGFSFEEAM